LILCSLTFLYVGFANGLSVWIPSYMSERFAVSPVQASVPVSGLWIGIIGGRVVSSFLSRRFEGTKLLLLSNVVAAIVVLVAFTVDNYLSLTVGLLVAGLFVGSTNPMAYALLNERFPEHRASASSALTFAGTLGLMIVPWLVGMVAERAGFWLGLLVLGLCPCGLAGLSGVLAFSRQNPPPELRPSV